MEKIQLLSIGSSQTIDATIAIDDKGNRVELIVSNKTLFMTAIHDYPFFALTEIREKLEEMGYLILIEGSRRNVYPSGMQYNTFSAYELVLGKPATQTVDILDKITTPEEISTVKEQEEYFNKWIESISKGF